MNGEWKQLSFTVLIHRVHHLGDILGNDKFCSRVSCQSERKPHRPRDFFGCLDNALETVIKLILKQRIESKGELRELRDMANPFTILTMIVLLREM